MEDFTAQENVMIPMRKLGQLSDAQMRNRAAELLDGVGWATSCDGLAVIFRRRHQRVAIARALATIARHSGGRTDRQPR